MFLHHSSIHPHLLIYTPTDAPTYLPIYLSPSQQNFKNNMQKKLSSSQMWMTKKKC